jgi:succinate dehydrogenase flavin-adding protein (antitoxin of CptAB toxin-antitoxin module)
MTNGGLDVRIESLDDMTDSGMWPIWTWACFPDLTEFWTPSYCDYVREIFMAQDVSINQMLDNAEAINKPMKIVNVEAIEDLAKLKYRRDGIIPTKGNFDANRAVQVINTPSINTPLLVFKELGAIAESEMGVTKDSMGVADEDGKVGIYEGNQAATADRFGLLNKSYAFGYKRFAKLYEWGVKEHLIKKVAVEIVGPKGVEIQAVSRKDMFRKGDDFGVLVEASNAELNTNIQEKRIKMTFLANNGQNPIQNPKKAYEMGASIIGFNEDDIKQLTDIQFYGNKELMSEADRDIEDLLSGEDVKPNKNANNAYRQKILDFMKDHEEDIDMVQFTKFTNYFQSLEPIVMANEARNLANEGVNMMNQQTEQIANTPIEEPINNGKQESYEI